MVRLEQPPQHKALLHRHLPANNVHTRRQAGRQQEGRQSVRQAGSADRQGQGAGRQVLRQAGRQQECRQQTTDRRNSRYTHLTNRSRPKAHCKVNDRTGRRRIGSTSSSATAVAARWPNQDREDQSVAVTAKKDLSAAPAPNDQPVPVPANTVRPSPSAPPCCAPWTWSARTASRS